MIADLWFALENVSVYAIGHLFRGVHTLSVLTIAILNNRERVYHGRKALMRTE